MERASEIHNNKYDYDKIVFENLNPYLEISCPIHGMFRQQAWVHLNGGGCKKCNLADGTRRYDTQAFIKAAKAVHGEGKYDYYMVEYLSGHEKVAITSHHIQHAENGGEYHFPEMPKRKADGFDEVTNTVLEFNGSLWHAEPKRYPADRPHPLIANKTCGEVYQKTLDRDEWIRDQGYTLVTMWELDWDAGVKAVIRLQRLWRQRKGISNGRKKVR
ncbi:g7908 [Coccomyxa viridis]|uniref:G7908 protein n=1 Tax=Coccomyxa viridis TaxID=1274662 RepID=A0ABP1FZ27_9CHLO